MNGAERIATERKRQIEKEGWTKKHDASHFPGCLAAAGASYALDFAAKTADTEGREKLYGISSLEVWPFGEEWWKPTHDDFVKQLTKAGALIAAEIDRLLANHSVNQKNEEEAIKD